ncbi:probable tRNA (uracil-O(2)-)-methyltransferase isoform X3 [Heterocephalus glaber]|uniref:Probable tRNA (uracil-O(2)-)-methyltransferase n=1 Tax=Heterocephalus glaber TaxID=10181 RepID=A0AAX6T218_HETGA|nr:probable tRNA (uracil-O(2)-)-methyltransferase isoform X3 [Heterocephalus glaber]
MAEVGRRSVCDSYALLPGGFWAAVAVWLERPQVANKRLCGARLEARQSATLPRAEALRPRLSAGPDQEWGAALCRPQEGPGTRWGSPEEDHGTWPSAGPEQERGAALCGPQERPGPGRSSVEGHPGPRPGVGPEEDTSCLRLEETQGPPQQGKEQREAAAAPLLAEQPHRTGSGEEDDPAADLGSLWDRFSQSLVCGHPEMLSFLTRSGAESQTEAPHELDLVLRTVIPKTSPHFLVTAPRREIVVQDVPNGTVTFLPLEEDDEGNLEVKMSNVYQIQLSRSPAEWFISVLIFCPEKWQSDGAIYPRCTWLGGELLGRLARWCVASSKRELRSTLSLVSIGRYSVLYQELKEKYRDMVRVWPEVTDPEKFVYEDVAIASYLLILWEEERAERGVSTPQSFVDLGCGNGLLVHILCNEGHPGRGIDVRRRKIWDMYGPHTQLEENAITPSAQTLFPAADWLIGNHSDELTPWIPVIAARSSYHCRFFVLPCCFFDFAGRFCRRQSRKTQYREYLDFIREVGEACGFHMEEDCLRIPSTKRVCLIGKSRTYPPAEEAGVDERRTWYLHSRRGLSGGGPLCPAPQAAACSSDHPDGDRTGGTGAQCDLEVSEAQAEGLWLPGFQPREKVERVRNCASLPRDFIDQVVLQVADLLLNRRKSHAGSPREGTCKAWNGGGPVHLGALGILGLGVSLCRTLLRDSKKGPCLRTESLSLAEVAWQLDRATLRRLKHECGGLQTLLRNSRQVFEGDAARAASVWSWGANPTLSLRLVNLCREAGLGSPAPVPRVPDLHVGGRTVAWVVTVYIPRSEK